MKAILLSIPLGLLLVFSSFQLSAKQGWLAGAEYQQLSSEADYFGTNIEFDVGVLSSYVGYQQPLSDKWSVLSTVRFGTGIKQDQGNQIVIFGDILADIDVEVSTYVQIQTQFEYRVSENGSVFVAPGVSRYDYTVKERSFNNQSISNWQLGISGGYTHRITNKGFIRIAYQHLSETDIFSIGYEHRF